MKRIAVVGYRGKMGKPIFLALEKKYQVFGVGRDDSLENLTGLDLVIDVANHESSLVSAEYCLRQGIPIIIGSTGQTVAENERIKEISKKIQVVKKANFSRGINLTKQLLREILKNNPINVKIVEKHHVHKKDAPSGTAIELKNFIEATYDGDIEITSIREGEEMGEHQIKFYFGDEELVVQHNVFSRMAFVNGILKEIEKLILKN